MAIYTGSRIAVVAARTVSIVFHPMLIPLYGLLIIFTAPTLFWYIPVKAKLFLFVIFIVNNLVIPVILMPFFRYRNLISSWILDNRSERTIPLLTVSLLYAITSFIFSKLQIPVFFKAYTWSLTMLLIALLTLNRWWKISVYSAGAGLLIAVVLTLALKMSVPLPFYLAGSVTLSGIIISSRLLLNAHAPVEVYTGFLAGLVVTGGLMILMQ